MPSLAHAGQSKPGYLSLTKLAFNLCQALECFLSNALERQVLEGAVERQQPAGFVVGIFWDASNVCCMPQARVINRSVIEQKMLQVIHIRGGNAFSIVFRLLHGALHKSGNYDSTTRELVYITFEWDLSLRARYAHHCGYRP